MGADCSGLCVPTILSQSVAPATWSGRSDLCGGCRVLDTPWAENAKDTEAAVGASLFATGAAPDYFVLVLNEPVHVLAAYNQLGQPVAGFRTDYGQDCGRLLGLKFAADRFGAYFLRNVGEPQELVVGAPSELGALMQSKELTYAFPRDVVGSAGINDFWFSSSLAAIDLSGSLVVADIAQGTTFRPGLLATRGPVNTLKGR